MSNKIRNRYLVIVLLAGLLAFLPLVARASVDLIRFEGWWADSHIMIEWQTVDEGDSQGFNLYRSLDHLDPSDVPAQATKLNGSMIPAHNGCIPGSGSTYPFTDTLVDPTQGPYYYWLESVDCSGSPSIGSDAEICVLLGDFVDTGGSPPADGKMTMEDLVYYAGLWHQTAGLPKGADVDGDGVVTIVELVLAGLHLNKIC